MRTVICEHGIVHYVQDEAVITEMGFNHRMVTILFACAQCEVSVLLDQQIEAD